MVRNESHEPVKSFLTEEQRTVLDTALAEKAAENAVYSQEIAKQQREARPRAQGKESKGSVGSAGGKGGAGPKRNGAGGKFTWGSIFTDGSKAETILDKNDPNYDSDEERVVLKSAHAMVKSHTQLYKEKVQRTVDEFFSSGEVRDVADALEDLDAPGHMHFFVKRLVTTALDRNNREREMASNALNDLYGDVIPADQVQKGFDSLVDNIGDLVLDVPDAPELLALFLARAVVDDVLPPAVQHRIPTTPASSATLKARLEQQLKSPHGAERILRCWGSGAGLTYQSTKESIAKLLEEFVVSSDMEEAARCLRSLNVPFFHHEVVKQAVTRAMELSVKDMQLAQRIVGLLGRLVGSGEISVGQFSKGLNRVSEQLDDLCLDNPAAREEHSLVMQLICDAGLRDDLESGPLGRGAAALEYAASTASSNAGTPASYVGMPRSLAAFKAEAMSIVREYFDSSDAEEVARRLHEMEDPGLRHVFIKLAIVSSLDRKDRERELISQLLTHLHPAVMSTDQVAAGFARLLAAADDLVLDHPEVVQQLALFLGRAVVDEVLPPAFLHQVLGVLDGGSLGVDVVRGAGNLLSARHGAERLLNAWHGGSLSIEQVRKQMQEMLKEYVGGARDTNEAARCLLELGVPYYHHEAVKAAIELAFADAKNEEPLVQLLSALSAANVITETQMAKGFMRTRQGLDGEALDFGPTARDTFTRMLQAGTAQGWLVMDPEG